MTHYGIKILRLLLLILLISGGGHISHAQSSIDLKKINLPPGFKIGLFARVPNARSMVVVSEHDAVFVGNRRGGSVFVAVDKNRDGRAEDVAQITSGLAMPNLQNHKDRGSENEKKKNRLIVNYDVPATSIYQADPT
jgi:hypothetical protein